MWDSLHMNVFMRDLRMVLCDSLGFVAFNCGCEGIAVEVMIVAVVGGGGGDVVVIVDCCCCCVGVVVGDGEFVDARTVVDDGPFGDCGSGCCCCCCCCCSIDINVNGCCCCCGVLISLSVFFAFSYLL